MVNAKQLWFQRDQWATTEQRGGLPFFLARSGLMSHDRLFAKIMKRTLLTRRSGALKYIEKVVHLSEAFFGTLVHRLWQQ